MWYSSRKLPVWKATTARALNTDSFLLRTSQAAGATGSDQRKRPRRSTSPLSSRVSQTPATCWGLKFKMGSWNMEASPVCPSPPPFSSLFLSSASSPPLLSVRKDNPRHPEKQDNPKVSEPIVWLAVKHKTTPGRKERCCVGAGYRILGLGKLGRQRAEGARKLKPEPRSIFQGRLGFKVGKK